MITAERVVQETRQGRSMPEQRRPRPVPKVASEPVESGSGKPSLLWRLVFFFVGFGLLMLGWPLAVSGVGAFIGVPLIIFGLALMQAQER
jgi:hypothetical protein